MHPGIITPGKMLITPNGKIGRCPSYTYQFIEGSVGCPCYLNPNPPPWDSQAIYQWGDCVSYDDKLWYSWYDGPSQGDEPGVSPVWETYSLKSCDNEDWHSIPPFGGIDKTPFVYGLSVDVTGHKAVQWSYGLETYWYNSTARVQAYFNLYYQEGCGWKNYGPFGFLYEYSTEGESEDGPWSQEGVLTQDDLSFRSASLILCDVERLIPLTSVGFSFLIYSALCTSGGGEIPCHALPFGGASGLIRIQDLPGCTLQDSINFSLDWPIDEVYDSGTNTANGRISWRPLDCDYALWDFDTVYEMDACVACGGQFYRSCASNNQGHRPEADASNICETGYWWRLT